MRYTFVQRSGFLNTRCSVGNKSMTIKIMMDYPPPGSFFTRGVMKFYPPGYFITWYLIRGGIIVAIDVPGGYNIISPRITLWGDFLSCLTGIVIHQLLHCDPLRFSLHLQNKKSPLMLQVVMAISYFAHALVGPTWAYRL